MAALVTSLRMYNATPGAAAAWRALFERVFRDLGLDVRFLDHRFPQPIADLWAEPGLCCAFMCGWPFVRSTRAMQAIAAPVPSPPRYAHLPRYCSEFLVREDSGWTSIEQSFGQRIGWMAADSQSGFNAPRAFLARFAGPGRPALYAQSVGPLGSPATALRALREGQVDVVALDGFFLDLCRRHEPEVLRGLRCVALTPWTPIPLLVAAPDVDGDLVQRLRAQLLGLHESREHAALMAEVLLERFVVPDLAAYGALQDAERLALELGYDSIR